MKPFEQFCVPRIVFGRGQFARAGELAKALGKKTLIVANGPTRVTAALIEQLNGAQVACVTLRQAGEPTVAQIDAGLLLARREACDCVIGIGGGSAIDAAKAIAGLLTNGDWALDFMEVVGKGKKITRPAAPWMAIPCTAGTGAEVTRNAVIGFPGSAAAGGSEPFKASLRSEHLLAKVALIDPELAIPVPPDVTARTGMDALCQCIEAYTSTSAQPLSDAAALDGITRAARSLRRAFKDGGDLEAREDLAMAALESGMALTNAGLGAVHGFAAPLGAAFPIPHGTICAALLAGVVEANIRALHAAGGAPGLRRYAAVGRVLVGQPALSDALAQSAAVDFLRGLAAELDIAHLGGFGLQAEHTGALCTRAQKSSSMRYNPVPLSQETLEAILHAAL